jgi:transposase-like protein/transposase InsO family protein
MLKIPVAWQAGLVLLVRPILKKSGIDIDTNKILKDLGVGRNVALDSARWMVEDIDAPRISPREQKKREKKVQKELNENKFLIEVFKYKEDHAGYAKSGDGRQYYSDEFKLFVLAKKKQFGLSWSDVARLLDISKDTLKKFKRAEKDREDGGSGPSIMPDNVRKLINIFLRRPGKKSVKEFCEKSPEVFSQLNLNYRQVLKWLSHLGFVSPTGIFLKNTGLDKIERFSPHAVWGTDGKNMNIQINGETFRWVWQCLIDYKTTVLVGGLLGEQETTLNLLEAIKKSAEKTGVTPMAIVLDNRLSENLPAIRGYLDELGIKIIKTFPGNSKSNGIIENNFSIFERWVGGKVVINGSDNKELSFSIAKMLTEVFTQLRNNQPRKGMGLKTAQEYLNAHTELPEGEKQRIMDRLNELANRFKNEQAEPITSLRKEQSIAQAVNELQPPNEDRFRNSLKASSLTVDIILQALAIFKQRKMEQPEKKFNHTYFGGILRNLANQQRVQWLCTHLEEVYSHHWETMGRLLDQQQSESLRQNPIQTCSRLATDYIKMPVPTYNSLILIQLKSMFLLASKGSIQIAKNLREEITTQIKKWKYDNPKKREHILQKLYEWETIVRFNDPVPI